MLTVKSDKVNKKKIESLLNGDITSHHHKADIITLSPTGDLISDNVQSAVTELRTKIATENLNQSLNGGYF